MQSPKPLFIPLKAEYFDAFRDGSKDTEYRPYGPRWNERACEQGRRVVLSRGYGVKARLEGSVAAFSSYPIECLEPSAAAAYRACYGDRVGNVAIIRINVYRRGAPDTPNPPRSADPRATGVLGSAETEVK